MALELEGRIVRKLTVQRGNSAKGPWAKQEFVIEYKEGNYPASVCMNVWGEDKVKDLEKFQVGDVVKVSFNLSSREFNGKWYTDIRAWKMIPAGAAPASQAAQASHPAPEASAVPFTPAPTLDDMPDFGPDNDLPF